MFGHAFLYSIFIQPSIGTILGTRWEPAGIPLGTRWGPVGNPEFDHYPTDPQNVDLTRPHEIC